MGTRRMNKAVKTKSSRKDLTTGPIFSKMIIFTVPLILSGLLQLLYNAADLVVAGRYAGEIALAAVGAVGAYNALLVNLFMGLSVGAGVAASHYIGAGEPEKVKRVTHTAFVCALVCGIFVATVCLIISRPVLVLMDTPDTVIDLSVQYMHILAIGMPASLIYNMAASVLRADGETLRPMIFLSVSGLSNFLLNLVFVIVLRMGVAGVATATVISQYISCICIIVYMSVRRGCCRFSFRELRVYKAELKKIIAIGVPAGLQSSFFSISNMTIQSSINSFGDVAMSGNTAASNIEGFIYVAMNAFHHAALNFVGQNYGARDKKRVQKSFWCSIITVGVVGAVLCVIARIFSQPLLGIYLPDSPEALEFGAYRMTIICATYYICGIMDAANGGLRGIGASMLSMLTSLFGSCVFRVVWIFTVFEMLRTPFSLYISYPISWLVTGGVQILLFVVILNRKFRKDPLLSPETEKARA